MPKPPQGACSFFRRGLTLFETLILAVLIAAFLFVVAKGMQSVRRKAREQLCIRLVLRLGEAVARYRAQTGEYPPAAFDGSAGPAIEAIRRVRAAAEPLEDLPSVLAIGRDPRTGVLDPWGRPLRYVTVEATREADRRDVIANGGVPIFESAGPDGELGLADPVAAADNIRSSDLR